MTPGEEFLRATLPVLDLVHNLARRLAHDRGEAEDLVQETYTRAWAAWAAGRVPRKVEPWLATICLNAGRDLWRRAGGRREVAWSDAGDPAASVDVEAEAIGHLQRDIVVRALWALPEEQRIAITLMDLCGLTAAETASITRAPRGTVLARVHRGRKALARRVEWGGGTNMMRHDPERVAAAYLSGELNSRRRERFESHVLGCDECWHELTAARRGRALAEALREVPPQHVRERIRGLAATTPQTGPRGWPGLRFPLLVTAAAVAVVLVVVLAGGWLVLRYDTGRGDQPPPIAAAVATYQQPGDGWTTTGVTPPVPRIGALTWRGATHRGLGGQTATVHLYADNAGTRLLVARSPQPFPEAAHLDRVDGGPSWVATVGDAVMFCADRPGSSWLAIGATRDQVLTAGRVLGLR